MSHPYGKIVTIDEGEVGLPHKMFYSLDNNHKVTCFIIHMNNLYKYIFMQIVKAYKMLLRDFAINMGK